MSNARLIEKDLFASVGAYAAGDSEVICLDKADRFSCQATYDLINTAKTFDSGGAEVDTGTFQALADTDPGDYIVIYDTQGLAWAVAADVTGTDPEPTGDVWVAIPAERKAQVDLSGETSADDVAAAFAVAFEALTDVPFLSAASTDDVVFTQDLFGVVTEPEVHNADDSGDGSIVVVVTDAGVDSEVNVTDNLIYIPAHGLKTGVKGRLTTTGTLPDPLAVLTDYWVINVDANNIQFAVSLQDALDGVPVELTDQGSDEAVNTFTPTTVSGATVTFQKSNDGTNWINIQSATTISADGSVMIAQPDVSYKYFKAVKALSAGSVDLKANVLVLGDAL